MLSPQPSRSDILVCYDVNTGTKEGRGRLRRVAKACTNYGQRVQDSVFECSVGVVELHKLRTRLLEVIVLSEDSLRIYHFRDQRDKVIESHGIDKYIDFNAPLIT